MTIKKLDFSIPANNQKIIELYNKIKKEELDPSPFYQRKLVWKKQHKIKFIQTILLNFPFPEIYIAPGILDIDELSLKDEIVDGQQRLTTIANYIEEKDIFSADFLPINKYSQLSKDEKQAFLNYEVSVRYLKNADKSQVKEIFQRINSTEYSLNKTERINAQWGDSEFICFGKQIIETDLGIDTDLIEYTIVKENRQSFLDFFHKEYKIFNETDISRMLALQFILTLLATICEKEYFKRNDKVQTYIEKYYETFEDAAIVEIGLLDTINFIRGLGLNPKSYWFNKANMFTLMVELYKVETGNIDSAVFKGHLDDLENENKIYSFGRTTDTSIPATHTKYFDYAKEAVNDKTTRDYRGKIINNIIKSSTPKGLSQTTESESEIITEIEGLRSMDVNQLNFFTSDETEEDSTEKDE